jgi:hypothetical protein
VAGALEVLDAMLGWPTALDVPVIQGKGRIRTSGDDKAGSGSPLQRFCLTG